MKAPWSHRGAAAPSTKPRLRIRHATPIGPDNDTAFKLRRAGEPTDRNAEHVILPPPKGDPKSPEWRQYIFARDQWHCRICGDRFQYSETVRKHIADAHDENMPPSMYEYFRGAVWQRKKIP